MALTKIPSSLLDTSGGFDLQGNITLGDSEKIILGDSSDLKIQHNGANSFIDNETGGLLIRNKADDRDVDIQSDDGLGGLANYFRADGSTGSAILYNYGNIKLETTSTGATVTGVLTATSVNTGQGDYELYAMDQNVRTTDSPAFAAATINGTLTVTGDLDITGDINSYNVTDLDVTDQTITLGAGQTEANSGGSGIIIDGSSASILWDETNTEFDINNSINVAGNIKIETTGNPIITNKTTGAGNNPVFRLQADTNYWDLQSTFSNTNDELFFMYNGASKMAIDNSGNVGIGTTLPTFASGSGLEIERAGIATLRLQDTTNVANVELQSGESGLHVRVGANGSSGDLFNVSSAGTSRLLIDSSGDVGIGTDDPDSRLHVYNGTSGTIATISGPNAYNAESGLEFSVGRAKISGVLNGSGGTPGTSLRFYTMPNGGSVTKRMTIDSTGNLLVGKDGTGDYNAGFEVQPAGAVVLYRTSGPAGLFGRTDNGEILRFTSNSSIVGHIGVVNSDRMYFTTADGLGLQFDKDNNRIVPCDAAGAYNNNVELGDSGLEFTNLWLSGTATIGSTAELNSGTNGTTAALRFKTTDNTDTSKFIRMSSYYMEYSGNSNEGHHFIDSASTSLLKVFGNTNGSYPRRIGMGTETPSGKLHVATGLEPNNVYITTGASGGTGYDVVLNMLGGANNSEMVINLGIDGDADRNQIKSYQGNLYTRVNNSQRAEINSAGKHTWWGTHQGDSVGHFLFTNQGFDGASVNCSLAVQNGYTFLQFMAWTSLGARIGTRTSGWNATGSQGTYLVAADATNIICTSGGSPTLSNGTGITSDERLKENITDIEDGQLAKIIALRPRNFTWKDSRKSGNMEGFIAQEVESIIPEAVEEREVAPDPTDTSRDFEGDVKVIKHEVLNARLIKAIQELKTELDAAKARITELEG